MGFVLAGATAIDEHGSPGRLEVADTFGANRRCQVDDAHLCSPVRAREKVQLELEADFPLKPLGAKVLDFLIHLDHKPVPAVGSRIASLS